MNNTKSENTAEVHKNSGRLQQMKTNAIDDVEQLLLEIERGDTEHKNKDDDDENDGNMTRLVDKI